MNVKRKMQIGFESFLQEELENQGGANENMKFNTSCEYVCLHDSCNIKYNSDLRLIFYFT